MLAQPLNCVPNAHGILEKITMYIYIYIHTHTSGWWFHPL